MSLIGWWKLDGDALDSSSSHINGGNNGVTFASANGIIGKGGIFNGTTDYINIDNVIPYMLTGHSHSFFAWIRSNGGNSETIFAVNNSAYSTNLVLFWVRGSKLNMYFNNVGFLGPGATTVDNGLWHHVGYVYDDPNDEVRMYVNGVLDKTYSSQTASGIVSTDRASIGQEWDTGPVTSNHFGGDMNDVRIYDHVLSIKEIKSLAEAKVLHWQFSQDRDTPGEIVADSSDYGRHATLDAGTPVWSNNTVKGVGCYFWGQNSRDHIQLTAAEFPINYGSSISISIWYKPRIVSAAWETLVHGTTASVPGWATSFWLAKNSATNVRFAIGSTYWTMNHGLVADQWYHFFVTYDGANVNGFVDGVQRIANEAFSTPIANESGIKIGYEGQGQSYDLEGYLADVRIYNKGYNEADGLAFATALYQTSAQLDDKGNLWC